MDRFDAKGFLTKNFQTPANVVSRLAAYGFETPKVHAVEKWFQRGRVPGEYWPLLVSVIELDRGRPVSVTEFLG